MAFNVLLIEDINDDILSHYLLLKSDTYRADSLERLRRLILQLVIKIPNENVSPAVRQLAVHHHVGDVF